MSDDYASTAVSIVEMSDDISTIAKALPKAQAAMGEVFKNASNPAFKTKYADLAAVISAVVPALNENGIAMLQPASFTGDRVNVATMFLHESGQWVRCTMSVIVTKRDAHGIGSAQTYCRRYGLMSMCGVAPDADDDANASVGLPTQSKAAQEPVQRPAEPPKAPSLAERASALEARLKAVTDADGLEKAIKLASGLMADLDDKDPERLAEIDLLIEQRRDGFSKREPVAA